MELYPKAIRFLIDAVRYRIEWFEHELAREDLSDDERSDLTNDMLYFETILSELIEAHQKTSQGPME